MSMTAWGTTLAVLLLLASGGCNGEGGGGSAGKEIGKESSMSTSDLVKPSGNMKIESAAFRDGEPIPQKHTLYGKNIVPPLSFKGAPPLTESFALVCADPDAMRVAGKEWVHWVVVDLPKDSTGIAEGAEKLPAGARQLKTDFGKEGYGGPRPPAGTGVHHYSFALYALKAKSLPVKSGSSLAEVRAAIKKEAIDQATLTGTYEMK